MKKPSAAWRWIGVVVFAWSVAYLYAKVDWGSVRTVLLTAQPAWVLLGGGVASLVYFALRAARLWLLGRRANPLMRYRDVYPITAVSLSFSDMTPGKLGEGLKVELLKRANLLARVEGSGAFLFERALDLLAVGVLGVASLVLLGERYSTMAHVREGFAVVLGVSALGLWLVTRTSLPARFGLPLARFRAVMDHPGTLAVAAILSVLAWCAVAVAWQLSLRSVAVEIDLAQSLWLLCLTAVVQIASFVPGGLGISEVVIAKTLEGYGVSAPSAFAGALILRCYGLVVIALGAVHWAALPNPGLEEPRA